MKFEIEKNVFVNGLQRVVNVVSAKVTMPIMSNVLLVAAEDKLFFTTTNSDIAIRCSVKANIQEEGRITLPAKKLLNIVRALPDQQVFVEIKNTKAKICSGNSKFDISGMNAEDFPNIADVEAEIKYSISFDQTNMARLLKNVSYAQSHDENRFILNGVFFSFEGNKMSFVATDGRRLSIISDDIAYQKIDIAGVIVPSKTINEIERMMGQGSDIRLSFNNKQVVFYIDVDKDSEKTGLVGNIFVLSKIIEGNYPNFKQVMPKEAKNRVKIDRQLLLEILQRISLVTSELKHSIKMKFSMNLLEIFASSPEYGEASETIVIQYEGEDAEIAFNPNFLCDPLKVLTQDEVYFEFNDSLSPGVFKTLDSFIGIVMPLRIS